MTKKATTRSMGRERGNENRRQEPFPDEITLKDEILELKRQLLTLKRTNEHHVVKLRKYEDEAKLKDKQVELLMDPRKNADVTKFLSTKGAAILMSLKDQNNALIQMLLNKDLHIRKLAAEIKMSKLYASTRKNESLRAEITRLRNLLMKSQETLKENVQVLHHHRQQQQQQTRSIRVGGNSYSESSSSSDQSTPRDLEELRATILSLESHIKHSNDLLAEKNHEISHLTSELNFLKSFLRQKPRRNKNFDNDQNESPATDFAPKLPDEEEIIPPESPEQNQNEHQQHTASEGSVDSSPEHLRLEVFDKTKEQPEESATNEEKASSVFGKSLFHNLAVNEILKEEKILSNLKKTTGTKEKWLKALTKYREIKKANPQMFARHDNSETDTTAESTEAQGANDVKAYQITENPDAITITTDETRNDEGNTPKERQNGGDSEDYTKIPWRKPTREIYRQSFDSSFDSDSSYSAKQEIRQVQVEVQIYSFSSPNDSDRSETGSFSKHNRISRSDVEEDGDRTTDLDFNDDDDVVVREK